MSQPDKKGRRLPRFGGGFSDLHCADWEIFGPEVRGYCG